MNTKYRIVTALASLITLASVGPAFATGDYYAGVDVNAQRERPAAAKVTDRRATGSIGTKASTYGFPNARETRPAFKGGEGEYYHGINPR